MSWGPQEVVVSLGPQQAAPSAAGTLATASLRTPTPVTTVSAVASTSRLASAASPAPEPGCALAAPVSRAQLVAQEPPSWSGRLVALAGGAADESAAYWRPVPAKGEHGLLESLHKRRSDGAVAGYTGGNMDFLLVHARPDEELSRNFSNHRNERVDLSHPMFKLSKAARAAREVESLHDDVDMRGRDVKRGLQRSLTYLQDDEFYLVKYRDYSSWATTFHRYDVRRDVAVVGHGYVERFFAVRVGQQAGVFMPIAEAQFRRGWELIQSFELSAAQAAGAPPPPLYLNADQFRALGGVDDAPPGTRMTATAAKARGREVGDDEETYDPADPPPMWWDYSPRAVMWRVRRHMKKQYSFMGQLVIKGGIVVAAYFAVRYMLDQRQPQRPRRAARVGSSYGGASAADGDAASMVGSLATAAAATMMGMPFAAASAFSTAMKGGNVE